MIGSKLLIKKLISTEKSNALKTSYATYCFIVHPEANKKIIELFIKNTFGVVVDRVNIVNYKQKTVSFRGKAGRMSGFKKVYVTLKNKTDVINFENLKV